LALTEEARELPDRELLLRGEREEAQAHGFGEHAVELPTGMRCNGLEHGFYLYTHTNERK